MKGKWTVHPNLPEGVLSALSSPEFVGRFMDEIIGGAFGVKHPRFRPSAFYVQKPDHMEELEPGIYGAIFTLSGATRHNDREPKVFHKALERTGLICTQVIQDALRDAVRDDKVTVHLFVNMMISGDVPLAPDVGGYSSIHETTEVWITADSVSSEMPAWILERAEAHEANLALARLE